MAIEVTVPVEQFGRDHWSTLSFVETRCVDYGGSLDRERMRCNTERHAAFSGRNRKWDKKWGTVLNGGTILPEHDDWDCLIDLAKAGYVEIINIDEGTVRLTDQGWTIAHQLRRVIAEGGNYKNFRV